MSVGEEDEGYQTTFTEAEIEELEEELDLDNFIMEKALDDWELDWEMY